MTIPGAPLENEMRLFCSLGWHHPKRAARWNNGYYFTKCTRCGHDLVRTARGRWRVPQGQRVVWPAGSGEQAGAAMPLGARPHATSAGPANGRSPASPSACARPNGPSVFDWAGVMGPTAETLLLGAATHETLAEIDTLERQLGNLLGLKVQIRHGEAGGVVAVEYATLGQLDTICQRLSGQKI